MKTLINRYIVLSTLVVLLCVHLGLFAWTLVRFTQIEHWSPGIQFFGDDMFQPTGITRSAVINLQEGTWPHLVRVRQAGGLAVSQIAADSPAEKAGLQSGDLIVSINGIDLKLNPEAYFQARMRSDPGDRFELTWIRDEGVYSGTLLLEATDHVRYAVEVNQQELVLRVGAMAWFQRGQFLIFPIVLLCFGTWMGFSRPHNSIAFQCALLFLTTALSATTAFLPMTAGWPRWVLVMSIGYITFAATLKFYLIFYIPAVYPTATAFGTWIRKRARLILAALLISGLFNLIYILGLTYGWNNDLFRFVVWATAPIPAPALPILTVVFAGILLLAQRSAARLQQRNRLRVVEAGFLLGLILAPLWVIVKPGTLLASWGFLPIAGPALPMLVGLLDLMVYVVLKCALPVSFAYAILAHRIFGLSIVFGRSLKYLVSSQTIYLLLCFGLFVVLYETISSWRAGQNVSDLLAASTAAGFMLILIGGWTWVKEPIARFVDRHFLKDVIENRERLTGFQRILPSYRDRQALLSGTGKELMEVFDLSCAAIYFANNQAESMSVPWFGVNKRHGQQEEKNSEFFTKAVRGIENVLAETNPDHTLIEYDAKNANAFWEDTGFEVIVVFRGESGRRGCIALGPKTSEDPFSSDEKEQLLVLAAELELALQNIEMSFSLRQQAQGLRRLSQRLINIQESERSRLAKDLHDDTGQALTALKMNLELTKKELSGVAGHAERQLDDAVALTGDTLAKLRMIAHDLRPPVLDTIGLDEALESLCRNFAQHTQVSVEYKGGVIQEIPNPVDISLYRILQEGLANSVKHGRATRIEVDLDLKDGTIQLSIRDNGRGFDPENLDRDEVGVGLIDMRERLESLEGHLDIESRPGAGTRLVATIPLESA